MIGRRRDVEPFEMEPGDYGSWHNRWWCKTPNGHGGALSAHEVVEHEDGTITVSPSILVSTRRNDADVELWHGYLRAGEWSTV